MSKQQATPFTMSLAAAELMKPVSNIKGLDPEVLTSAGVLTYVGSTVRDFAVKSNASAAEKETAKAMATTLQYEMANGGRKVNISVPGLLFSKIFYGTKPGLPANAKEIEDTKDTMTTYLDKMIEEGNVKGLEFPAQLNIEQVTDKYYGDTNIPQYSVFTYKEFRDRMDALTADENGDKNLQPLFNDNGLMQSLRTEEAAGADGAALGQENRRPLNDIVYFEPAKTTSKKTSKKKAPVAAK